MGFEVDATVTAKGRLAELGFDIKDVRHVIPTHLDNDHAGAIYEFPYAKIHTSDLELDAALNPKAVHEFIRYRDFHLKNFKNWSVHNLHEGENWFGFSSIKAIPGLKDEILLIPLTGHTRGHFGVAVESEGKWLFHVGDSYYLRDELTDDSGLLYEPFLRSVHGKYRKVKENLTRIYQLTETHPEEVRVFSAHDPEELRQLQTS